MAQKMVKINALKTNEQNPRMIRDLKFKQLVQSIKDFPEMMAKRPIVCVTDPEDGKLFPIGGNMRLQALIDLKYKEIPENWIANADEWPEEKRKEFVIKDNVNFGEWDYDVLANTWDVDKLEEWGLDVYKPTDIDIDGFFEENGDTEKEQKFKIVLEYSESDFQIVSDALEKYTGTKEQIIFNLLK